MSDESPVPDAWRLTVAGILRDGVPNTIFPRAQADRDWEAAFPSDWLSQRNEAMAGALEVEGVTGRRILDMREPGEVWAFWFHHQHRKLYGKINLAPEGKVIIIYSSHIPHKGEDHL